MATNSTAVIRYARTLKELHDRLDPLAEARTDAITGNSESSMSLRGESDSHFRNVVEPAFRERFWAFADIRPESATLLNTYDHRFTEQNRNRAIKAIYRRIKEMILNEIMNDPIPNENDTNPTRIAERRAGLARRDWLRQHRDTLLMSITRSISR